MEKKKEKKKYSLLSNVVYVYKILFREVHIMPLLVIAGIIIGIVLPIFNTLVSTVAVASIENKAGVKGFILAVCAVLVIYGLLVVFNKMINSWSEFYLTHVQSRKFLLGLLMKALTADYDNVEPQKQQAMLSGASHAVHVYRQGVHLVYEIVPVFISAIIGFILYSATITFLDIRILIVIIVMNVVSIILNLRAVKIARDLNEEQYALWGRVYYLKRCTMSTESGKDIRIYGMREWFHDAFIHALEENKRMSVTRNKGWSVAAMTNIEFDLLRDLLTYGILVSQVIRGDLNLAEFTFGLGIVSGFANWIGQIQYSWIQLTEGNTMLVEYRRMIDYPDRFKREGGIGVADIQDSFIDGTLSIVFDHVSFRYEEDGPNILEDINLEIKPGEKIALVGHNGAGKTTLIKLLCGLYHPTEGQILVGGHSVEEFNLEEYLKLLSTIFQDISLLPLSILENISGKGPEDSDRELVMECIKQVGLMPDVEKMVKKEMTYISQDFDEEGVQLSGGMEQKLVMARVLYKKAPIIILDEPTAALDPIAESNLYEEYNDFAKGKTSIFISHRLASTKFCDRIIFLENGMVAESGTHEQLMRRNGKYAEVFQVQSQYYQEEEAKQA